MSSYKLLIGDCLGLLKGLPEGSVNCCVTSPPYFGLRDYGMDGQIGLELTPEQYVAKMVAVFREVRRALRDDGTLWLNIGDSYGKGKQLIGIPWRLAFALQADGWVLRQEIIWHKPNPMPESVKDRCTKAHEQIFLLSKSPRYYFDSEAMKEDAVCTTGTVRFSNRRAAGMAVKASGNEGRESARQDARKDTRNRRSVWSVATRPYKGAHFATFPPALIEPCILAGCPVGGVVLDPFGGSGTTAGVAVANGRNAILCELNPEYGELVQGRVESIVKAYNK